MCLRNKLPKPIDFSQNVYPTDKVKIDSPGWRYLSVNNEKT